MAFDQNSLRQRFHEARAEREARIKELAPTRAAYEELRAQQMAIDEKIKPLRAKITAANQIIGGLDGEIALLARAVGGKTGEA